MQSITVVRHELWVCAISCSSIQIGLRKLAQKGRNFFFSENTTPKSGSEVSDNGASWKIAICTICAENAYIPWHATVTYLNEIRRLKRGWKDLFEIYAAIISKIRTRSVITYGIKENSGIRNSQVVGRCMPMGLLLLPLLLLAVTGAQSCSHQPLGKIWS